MKYDVSHTNPMGWTEFHQTINKLIDGLKGDSFDAVTPILRSGAIPATMIANKLQIIRTIPVQVKYNYEQKNIDGYDSYHVGQWTNEAFKNNAPQYCRECITIFPWETAENELADINSEV